jgi:excisionase family DNA binding protein
MAKLLTVNEVAGLLRIARRTCRIWRRTGKLPAVKVGKHWLVREEDVEVFLKRAGQAAAKEHP